MMHGVSGRRGWIIAGLALALMGSTVSCETSEMGRGASPFGPFDSLQPRSCPDESTLPMMTDDNKVAGMTENLVPGHPVALVLCTPDGARNSIEGNDYADQVAHRLNAMKLYSSGVAIGCPTTPGATSGVFFSYPSGDTLLVVVNVGCGIAGNGHVLAHTNNAVKRLLHARFHFG
jgi:hypothetical protein